MIKPYILEQIFLEDKFIRDEDGLLSCYCPSSCVEAEYTSKISTYKFPSVMFNQINGYSEGMEIKNVHS